ncbi:Protein with carboxyl methyl esterase activity [Serendipita sp. 399]|nr:Protein with carboxyl methyl esterase activity [Serendipita sp. 399]
MSNLQKSAMQARIAKLPYIPTIAPQYHDAEDVEEREEAMSTLAALPKMLPPPRMPSNRTALRRVDAPDLSEYSPISASGYFVQAMNVKLESRGIEIRAYYSPPVVQDPASSSDEPTTVMVCHHGAGYSGLSFACFAKEVVELSKGECGVLAFDVRRHGAVCVRACPTLQEKHYKISGVAVLDVVEGSALEALPIMMGLLESRPDGFSSVEEAIQWHVTTHTLRNLFSARISIPSIFVKSTDPNVAHEWVWRTPLRSTSPYWTSWFKGLSSKFLACRTARLLALAGTDRLDKELMIGQMQGKFQLEVIPDVGHMLHEVKSLEAPVTALMVP